MEILLSLQNKSSQFAVFKHLLHTHTYTLSMKFGSYSLESMVEVWGSFIIKSPSR